MQASAVWQSGAKSSLKSNEAFHAIATNAALITAVLQLARKTESANATGVVMLLILDTSILDSVASRRLTRDSKRI